MKIRYTLSFDLDIDETSDNFGGTKEAALEVERKNFPEWPEAYFDMDEARATMEITVEEAPE